jgi:shikimate kinase
MKTGIALIGFMGTGKTVVGKLLAQKLVKDYIELDAEIEKEAGKSVVSIFREDGEARFREMETEMVGRAAGRQNAVIACGGGIVLNKENISRLKQEYVIVCLTASQEEIFKRTSEDSNTRPLLAVADRKKKIRELLELRRPLYEQAADITIDTSGIDAPGVVQKILIALDKYESHD